MMDKVIYCGFQTVSGEIDFFRTSTMKKGKKLYASGHVDSVKEVTHSGLPQITAKCLSQVSVNKTYNVFLQTTKDRKISQGHCSCKAGVNGKCKHVAALLRYINEHRDESKTAEKQSWGIPKVKEGYSKGKTLSEMFPRQATRETLPTISIRQVMESFPGIDCPLYTAIIAQDKTETETVISDVMINLVDSVCKSELQEILQNTLSKVDHPNNCTYKSYRCDITGIKLILRSNDSNLTAKATKIYQRDVCIQLQESIQYALHTIQQADCALWRKLRKTRMSSSKAHRVVTRVDRFQELAESFMNETFCGNTATKYGQQLERAAKAAFSFKRKIPLFSCGVVISPKSPWLCSSPDALFFKDGFLTLLEVKCPFSRKGLKITEGSKSYVRYLVNDGTKFILKKTHEYYTQVQISMYVLNLYECEIYIYSAVDNITVIVKRDDAFLQNAIPKLHHFYFSFLLDTLANKSPQ